MIECINGDIFKCNDDVILHQVNCQGVMGSGIALDIKQRYPNVFDEYKKVCDENKLPRHSLLKSKLLGEILVCSKGESEGKYIVNLFSQDRYGNKGCYTDYEALKKCLGKVNAKFSGKCIAIPYKMACNRGGGDWNIVIKIIEEELKKCFVKIYRLKE